MKRQKMLGNRGFTLMEVIVVIAIIAILAAVAIPSVTGYIEKGKETADLQSARSIITAVATVYTLNTEIVPEGAKIVIRWDTSKGGATPNPKGDVIVEHRIFGGFHTSADKVWIDAFATEFDEYITKQSLGEAKSKRAKNTDFLMWYDTETGDVYTHEAYMEDWVDGIGLNLKSDVF